MPYVVAVQQAPVSTHFWLYHCWLPSFFRPPVTVAQAIPLSQPVSQELPHGRGEEGVSLKFVTFLIHPSLRIAPEPSVVVESLDACFPRRSNLLTPKANTPTITLPRAGVVLIHFGPIVLIVENTRAERSCKFHSLPRDQNRLKMGERHRGHGRNHHGC